MESPANYQKLGKTEMTERLKMFIVLGILFSLIISAIALYMSVKSELLLEEMEFDEYSAECFTDEDGDGVPLCIDCDDTDETIGAARTWYLDEDGDGQGSLAFTLVSCIQPNGYSQSFMDCDDSNKGIYSGAEICDITQLGQQFTLSPTFNLGIHKELFGYSIKLFGERLVVGHPPFGIVFGSANKGRAYVYKQFGAGKNVYALEQELIPSIGPYAEEYGRSVSGIGDLIVVLSELKNGGSVFVFEKSGSNWVNIERIENPEPSLVTFISVDISDETIIIGAHNSTGDNGRIYVYDRIGSTTWDLSQTLTSESIAPSDLFGSVVSIDGNVTVGGAPQSNSNGLAVIFEYNGTQWNEVQIIVATGEGFGTSVDVSGTNIAVGAPGRDLGVVTNHGVAYHFARDATEWILVSTLIVPGREKNDLCGSSVAIKDDTIIVGCPFDSAIVNDTGSIAIFIADNFVGKLIPFDILQDPGYGRNLGHPSSSIDILGATIAGGGVGYIYGDDPIEGRVYIASCFVTASC